MKPNWGTLPREYFRELFENPPPSPLPKRFCDFLLKIPFSAAFGGAPGALRAPGKGDFQWDALENGQGGHEILDFVPEKGQFADKNPAWDFPPQF